MKFVLNKIDTSIFKKTVGDLIDFDKSIDFNKFETSYIQEFLPFYVVSKVDATDLEAIHILEENGFKFIELQIKVKARVKKMNIPYFNCNYALVDSENDLDEIINIARTTFVDDRVTVDKELLSYFSEDIAAKRYEAYVRYSYQLDDQRLYKVFNEKTGQILAFFSFMFLPNNEILTLLEGVAENYKKIGIGATYPAMYYDELIKLNVNKMYGAFSGRNIAMMNMAMGYSNYKATKSLVVMRKIYS